MASRPKRPAPAAARRAKPASRKPAGTQRDRIIDALMALLAEQSLDAIGLGDIAARAGVSLGELRDIFDGKWQILSAFSRRIDRQVLDGLPGTTPEEGARDRLFDAMMRRFDALAPYKAGLRSLARSARRHPGLGLGLSRIAARSQMWMLAAAGVHHRGILGRVAIKGSVLVYLETLRAWFEDDGEDMARTMAALDRSLRRGERAMQMASNLCGMLPRMAERARRARDSGRRAATA